MNRIIPIGIALALASLVVAATVAAQAPARPDSSRFLSVRQTSPVYGLASDRQALMEQVRDPLFGFVFTMVEHDSLGTWRADDLLDFAAAWGEPSAFPLAEHLESLTREALPDGPQERRGANCRRQWVVRLRPERLEIPMPYSILGYHPGKLSFDGPIVLREWPLGERSIHVSVEDVTRRYLATAVTVFEIAAGWIILDVDAWLDTLLGSAADDAAMRGFVVGWVDGELVGVGNSAGRKGRRILGELDFRSGEVANHGRPVARGLSSDARAWTSRRSYDPREIWRRYDD
jgi:hypothetical protein